MVQQLFLSSSKFSASGMTLDSRNTQKQGGAAQSTPKIFMLTNIFATFYVKSRLLGQFFECDNFYLSQKY